MVMQKVGLSRVVFSSNFNGKEKDCESGFHYYGARYYWSELLTGWLSVDPMMDKYPGISPYNYCMWNPVRLVDPNGMDTIFSFACNTVDKKRNLENENILRWMRGIGDQPDVVSIGMHGNANGVTMSNQMTEDGTKEVNISAGQLANIINNKRVLGELPTYCQNNNNGIPTIFILYSCQTGNGDGCVAQQLSVLCPNSIVIAPTGNLYISKKSGKGKNKYYIRNGKTFEKPQKWNVYYKGKLVASFRNRAPRKWVNENRKKINDAVAMTNNS